MLFYLLFGTIYFRLFRRSVCRDVLVAFRLQYPDFEPVDLGLIWMSRKYAYFTVPYRTSKVLRENYPLHIMTYSRSLKRVFRSRPSVDMVFQGDRKGDTHD